MFKIPSYAQDVSRTLFSTKLSNTLQVHFLASFFHVYPVLLLLKFFTHSLDLVLSENAELIINLTFETDLNYFSFKHIFATLRIE